MVRPPRRTNCVTAGASQALDLICTLYTEPGDIIFAEEPSYFLALRIFEDHKLRVMGVPTDEDGMDMEALADMLNYHKPKFIYTIPTFQNPAGFTLPTERRLQLITLSQIHNFKIVADEVYHCLAYGDPPPPLFWCVYGRQLSHRLDSVGRLFFQNYGAGAAVGLDSGRAQSDRPHRAVRAHRFGRRAQSLCVGAGAQCAGAGIAGAVSGFPQTNFPRPH
ncbi:MAG: aminotransferase class I/II-fold pyridoxal phosphate-dependent enzyme [Caldilineaceae bacterium]